MKKIKPIFKTLKDKNYFFGYYDKSPINLNCSKHLALEVDFINRLPNRNDVAKIGYFDLEKNDNIFYELEKTTTFNWQQGCMLEWFGDKNNQVIYNDLIDGKYKSVILDIITKEKTILPMSIYTLSSNNDFALCIDNERHHWVRRGYSYDGISNDLKNKNLVDDDGIWFLDINKKETKQIINIKDILNYKPLANMKDSIHYLEHLMLNTSNKRFAFFHRWKMSDGGIYSRLYTANIDGTDIYLLNDSGRMSHFSWIDNDKIFGWGGTPNAINSLRKYKNVVKFFIKPLLPLYKKIVSGNAIEGTSKISSIVTGDSYIIFNDKSEKKEKISLELLDRDGHPSICPINKSWVVTDTYPNNNSTAQLILFNINTKEKILLNELSSIKEFDNSVNRCDLHPKWSFDGECISIDTMNDGIRSIYLYDVSEIIK